MNMRKVSGVPQFVSLRWHNDYFRSNFKQICSVMRQDLDILRVKVYLLKKGTPLGVLYDILINYRPRRHSVAAAPIRAFCQS